MNICVKFCPCNFEDELEATKIKLRERGDLDVIEERCLLYCGQCLMEPFALVNGENIVTENPEELYEKIDQFITGIKQENA
ncbi:hypothetical protein WQ54_14510 [Bacillus sp. SA1-12]|uniref:DUF1450 domain-containing protein n=1 Tax=Bacillus sp. SA1-12 TaxID=1455638 RepID=UPI000626D28B|nr:DUF1450 domain-containing protein [Bacillus sp. SA1-12]KKI91480.1 hypothetical protein WQ54_14510 [Bacillus sp. SA1-12]